MDPRTEDLERIEAALQAASELLVRYSKIDLGVEYKGRDNPVTEADRAADGLLREMLLRPGEGWLSEESVDDRRRLHCDRVWVVDPLDGTKEFVAGIPEWCVSVGLVEAGVPVAGGICNPATGESVVGALGVGVALNGAPVGVSRGCDGLQGALVLASRSEVKRGEWRRFEGLGMEIRAMGSVAYKLGLVAAGRADATWTLVPKNEWDVAAGVALVRAAGGAVVTRSFGERAFNREDPLLDGLIAASAAAAPMVLDLLRRDAG